MSKSYLAIDFDILRNKDYSANEKLVFGYLLGFQKSTGSIFPSYAKIAEDLGMSSKTVQRAIGKLEEVGAITSTQRMNNSKVYQIADRNKLNVSEASQEAPQEVVEEPKVITHPEPEVVSQPVTERPVAIPEPAPKRSYEDMMASMVTTASRPRRSSDYESNWSPF